LPIDKVVATFDEAVADVGDGSSVLYGGFGGPGECPSYLIAALVRNGARDLTIIGNHAGYGRSKLAALQKRLEGLLTIPTDYVDAGYLVESGQVRKGILSFPAASSTVRLPFEEALANHEVEVETVPQGTLVERIRAARAGIPAFYTPTGPGTITERGKEKRVFGGRECVMEVSLRADFALIRAHRADRFGNLVYRGTMRTFNASMAGAATVTIAEVDELVELGELSAECIVTPGLYVDRVVRRPDSPRDCREPA